MERGAHVVAVMNQKGGVGKTTTAVNLGASLAVLERSVLLVDLDPQGAVSACFGVTRDCVGSGVYDAIVGGVPFTRSTIRLGRVPIDLVPANIWSDDEEARYCAAVHPRSVRDALAGVRGSYEYVILDSPPTMGPVAVAAMAAADAVLVPVQCEELAVLAVGKTLRLMRKVRAELNPDLALAGIVVTMADGRTNLTAEVANGLRQTFGDALMRTFVPRSVELARSVARGEPLLYYHAAAAGAQAYLNLAWELLQRTARASAA